MVNMVTWPTFVGIMLIIVMASLGWWWWKKRQMKESGVKVKLAGSASASAGILSAQLVRLLKISSVKLQ